MSDYRVFNRTAAGFDGTTVETADYTQLGFVWSTTTVTAVGRFTPASLGRNNICSLARVSLEGTITGVDTVDVVSTSGQVRRSVVASLDSSGWLFLLPGDSVSVNAPGATGGTLIVNDLSEAELQAWSEREGCCSDIPSLPLPQHEIEVTATQAIPPYDGHLIVNMDCAADADLTLPALADTTPGLCAITFVRIGDPGQPRIIPEDGTDAVNGRVGVVANQYFVRSKGDAITYLRVTAGWAMQFGDQARDVVTVATNPLPIPSVRGGSLYVVDAGTVLDNQDDLPPIGNCETGARVVVFNSDTQRHDVKPTAPDLLNGSASGLRKVGPKQVVVAEATSEGWMAYGGGNQAVTRSSGAAISLTAAEVSGGVATVEMTGAVGQLLNLPPLAEVEPGSMIVVLNNTGFVHSFVPNGTNKINGVAASLPDAAADRTLIVASSATIGWMTITSA